VSWRGPVSALGTLLVVVGLGGFAFVAAAPALPAQVLAPIGDFLPGDRPQTFRSHPTSVSPPQTEGLPTERHPITRLVIASINLDTEVVPSPLVEHDGTTTWDVPKFVAGHAEGTPGAGDNGNAVVLGHVTSLTLGNVFERLDRVQPGDPIQVYSDSTRFDYVAADVGPVDRTDTRVLDQSTEPVLTLITCTGTWLPTVWDYSERLIVRAELTPTAP
jgi:LPXTG-site transpeptidase (sortase) family protein